MTTAACSVERKAGRAGTPGATLSQLGTGVGVKYLSLFSLHGTILSYVLMTAMKI